MGTVVPFREVEHDSPDETVFEVGLTGAFAVVSEKRMRPKKRKLPFFGFGVQHDAPARNARVRTRHRGSVPRR